MIAGGGGGPIHGGFIADSLGVLRVVVPPVAALYSAFGMFAMDIGQDYARSFVSRSGSADVQAINRLYAELEAEAHASFEAHGVAASDVVLKRSADLRYVGQFHAGEVDMPGGKLTRSLGGARRGGRAACIEAPSHMPLRWTRYRGSSLCWGECACRKSHSRAGYHRRD